MSRTARIVISVWDGDYVFALRFGELVRLQDECGCGPMELLNRLQSGRWRVQDREAVLRLGLIGGGMPEPEAHKIMRQHVKPAPALDYLPEAQSVLMAALAGAPEEDAPPTGEPEAAADAD